MFFEKKIRGEYGKYHCEISVYRESNRFEIRIYKDPPTRFVFGVPVRRDPLIARSFPLEKPFKEAAEELILEWERPMKYGQELKEWDGIVREEPKPDPEPMPEPTQPTEENGSERTITITDYENPEPEIIRFKEDERIIPVSDYYNPRVKYIKLKETS